MKHSVELEYEVVDKLIVSDLLSQLDSLLEDPWSMFHSYEKTSIQVAAFLSVISYYSTEEEFKEICLSRQEKLAELIVKVHT